MRKFWSFILSALLICLAVTAAACGETENPPAGDIAADFTAVATVGEGENEKTYNFKIGVNLLKSGDCKIVCTQDNAYELKGSYVFDSKKGYTFSFANKSVRAGFDKVSRNHTFPVNTAVAGKDVSLTFSMFDTSSFTIGADYVHPNDENVKERFFGSASSGPMNAEVTIRLKNDMSCVVSVFSSNKTTDNYGSYTFADHVYTLNVGGVEYKSLYNETKNGYAINWEVAGFFKMNVAAFFSPDGVELSKEDFPDLPSGGGGFPPFPG